MRLFIVGAAMLVILFGVACSSTSNDQENPSQETSAIEESTSPANANTETTQPQTQSNASSQQNLSIGDTATFAYESTVTVLSFTSPAQPTSDIWTPAPGMQYAAIDVEACTSDTEVTSDSGRVLPFQFNPYFFTLQMPDNTRLDPTISVVEPALNAVDIMTGDCVRGNVSFEIPQGVVPRFVVIQIPFQTAPAASAKWAIGKTMPDRQTPLPA